MRHYVGGMIQDRAVPHVGRPFRLRAHSEQAGMRAYKRYADGVTYLIRVVSRRAV